MAEILSEILKRLLRVPTCNQYQKILAGKIKSVHVEASQRWVICPRLSMAYGRGREMRVGGSISISHQLSSAQSNKNNNLITPNLLPLCKQVHKLRGSSARLSSSVRQLVWTLSRRLLRLACMNDATTIALRSSVNES